MCSWQSIKITTSEESLINMLLNLLEGKICDGKSNSEHKIFCKGRGKKKKKAFKTCFPPCCVQRGGTVRRRVLHPSPCTIHLPRTICSGSPHFPRDYTRGITCTTTASCFTGPTKGGNNVSAHRVAEKKPKQLMDSGWGWCPGSITQLGPAELGGFAERASGLRKGM